MSITETKEAKRYAAIAEVAAAQAKIYASEAINAPQYTETAKQYAEISQAAAGISSEHANSAIAASEAASSSVIQAQGNANDAEQFAQEAAAAVTGTLRVPEPDIPSLPDSSSRAGLSPAFDGAGNPVVYNAIGSDRLSISRSFSEAGKTLSDGSFEQGATLESKDDVLWYQSGGIVFYWDGAFPKNVPSGSTPDSTGGVAQGAWVNVTDLTLRSALASDDEDKGTSLVRDQTGKLLQDALIVKVATIDDLRFLTPFNGAVSEVTTTGRRGLFKFIASDLSDPVLLDTAAGVFVSPNSDLSGASGAWVRQCFSNELGVPANGEFVCVDWFGADNSGDSYSSDAIRAAFTFHSYVEFSGKYKYSGAAIDPSYGGFRIVGNDSELRLDAGVVFIDFTGTIRNPDVRDLRIYGGETQITFENSTNNTFYENRVFKNVSFFDYTKIGLRITDRDCPYWVVEECVFAGLTAVGTIGLWDNSSDTNVVSKCKFLKNQIHLSGIMGSGMYSVTGCDFIQTVAGIESSPRASIWYRIPNTVPPYTGNIGKQVIERCKFGNENARSYDTKLLFANVAADSHLPDFVNYSGEPKTCNLYLRENTFAFSGAYPSHFSRSVGPFIPYDTFISGCNMTPGLPSLGKYVFYFDNVGTYIFLPRTVWIDTAMQRDAGSQYPLHNFTNADTFVRLMAMNDIDILTAGMPIVHSPLSWHGGVKTDVTTDILPSILTSGSVTTVAGVDSLGGAEARVVTIAGSSHAVWQKMAVPTLTDAIWCQGELKLDDSFAADFVYIRVAIRSTGASPRTYATIVVKVYKRWSSFCFPVNAKTDSGYANWQIMYEMFNQSTYPVTFHVGKSRAYRSKTPQPMGVTRFDSLLLSNVPTSSAGLPSGAVWSDGGVLKIV